MYLAMWSGPRNVSTAMLRAFGQRSDTAVSDEPLYAAYLATTGKQHPGREAILASQPTDYALLREILTGPIPGGRTVWYQKHMAHHLVPEARGPWLSRLTHCFLVREPDEMLSSLLKVWPDAELEDTGLPQQVALFEQIRTQTGTLPPVLDGRAVMDNPQGSLMALCQSVGIPWDSGMLAWPAGPRATDGVWAPYWYSAVRASTGFAPWRPREIDIPTEKEHLRQACRELYERLVPHLLKPLPDQGGREP